MAGLSPRLFQFLLFCFLLGPAGEEFLLSVSFSLLRSPFFFLRFLCPFGYRLIGSLTIGYAAPIDTTLNHPSSKVLS